jgi:hypothetical protein
MEPQPLEDQRRSDTATSDAYRRILTERAQHHRFFGKPCIGSQQPLQLTARLEVLVASERGDHPLANLVALRLLSTICRQGANPITLIFYSRAQNPPVTSSK